MSQEAGNYPALPPQYLDENEVECIENGTISVWDFYLDHCRELKGAIIEDDCPICWESLNDAGKSIDQTRSEAWRPVKNDKCRHMFHAGCLKSIVGLRSSENGELSDTTEQREGEQHVSCPFRCCKWFDTEEAITKVEWMTDVIDIIQNNVYMKPVYEEWLPMNPSHVKCAYLLVAYAGLKDKRWRKRLSDPLVHHWISQMVGNALSYRNFRVFDAIPGVCTKGMFTPWYLSSVFNVYLALQRGELGDVESIMGG
ncbi:hypothetical protein LTR37_001565 [Vermiconidia calcicola]|uniref:Uncharacterized protein n=1 Tax=Vermiconidia calcicola TaxID=1690605 RepID=A0ACC3NV42_9PEZI|nr:hypothetical protein LTR37_001565 [Vermiconidia calcicola]